MAKTSGHLEVELTLLPTERSGRRAPLVTGSQTTFLCEGAEWDAFVVLDEVEYLFPSESGRVCLQFRRPELASGRLSAGQNFCLRDGQRIIATGTVRGFADSEFSTLIA